MSWRPQVKLQLQELLLPEYLPATPYSRNAGWKRGTKLQHHHRLIFKIQSTNSWEFWEHSNLQIWAHSYSIFYSDLLTGGVLDNFLDYVDNLYITCPCLSIWNIKHLHEPLLLSMKTTKRSCQLPSLGDHIGAVDLKKEMVHPAKPK